jgi:hypothetical protein
MSHKNTNYKFIRSFLTGKILKNLIILLVLDLNKPEEIAKSFADWATYINKSIIPIINEAKDTDSTLNDHLEQNMHRFFQRNAMIIQKKSLMDDYNGGPLPIITPENINADELTNSIDFRLGIPFIIVGNKYDRLNQRNNSLMLEHVQYSMRKMALKYGATLMLGSSMNSISVSDLISYLSIILLEKEVNPEFGVTVRLEEENLMIPFGFDAEDLIEDLLGREEVKEYTFSRSAALDIKLDFKRNKTIAKKMEKEIIPVREFLKNCKIGKHNQESNGRRPRRWRRLTKDLPFSKEGTIWDRRTGDPSDPIWIRDFSSF